MSRFSVKLDCKKKSWYQSKSINDDLKAGLEAFLRLLTTRFSECFKADPVACLEEEEAFLDILPGLDSL